MTTIEYSSPFVAADIDHDSDQHMFCLSRANCDDPVLETFSEAARSAVILAVHSLGTAFYLGRQAAELALKAFIPAPLPRRLRYSHSLAELLDALAPGDDLLGAGTDQQRIVAFIRDFHRLDPRGDQGRYPTTGRASTLSLIEVCHADADRFITEVNRLAHYTELRLAGHAHVPISV
ncbi:hypothetical protein ACWEKT_39925 [Nocardia takedensis]